ncbi:MAG: sugar phosphate nucleotidyltransferase [Candidatus Thorarchaeota archaeon]
MSLPKNNIIEKLISIILCAGEGTRISDFIPNLPKPLIEIYDKPILSHLIYDLIQLDIAKVIIITGHLRGEIEKYVVSLKIKDESLGNKLLLINSGNNYKKGPLYSFLSITTKKSILRKDNIYLIFPGDTYFEPILLKEIIRVILNNSNKSILFYQKMKAMNLKTQFNTHNLISIAEIEETTTHEIIVKELKQKKLMDINNNEEINLIVPLFVFNYKIIKKIMKIERKILVTTIREALNHIITQENILYGVPIDLHYKFIDIDTKSDILSLNQKKKGKGQ